MSERPVFRVWNKSPYVAKSIVEFLWYPGMALCQKQKSIRSLHEAFGECCPGVNVLEVSSKSYQDGGASLSAFNLKKFVPSLGKSVPVECIYHASKVFEQGGPFTDLLEASPIDAKKDIRLKNSGKLIAYEYEGKRYPLKPVSLFYDYIYINALIENEKISNVLFDYDAFTDIEFNPSRMVNCQARAAARYVSLCRNGKKDEIRDYQDFFRLMVTECNDVLEYLEWERRRRDFWRMLVRPKELLK